MPEWLVIFLLFEIALLLLPQTSSPSREVASDAESTTLYFFAKPSPQMLPETLPAIVEVAITQKQAGYVHFQATSWSARFYQAENDWSARPGQSVSVVAIQGNTLLVMPIDKDASSIKPSALPSKF